MSDARKLPSDMSRIGPARDYGIDLRPTPAFVSDPAEPERTVNSKQPEAEDPKAISWEEYQQRQGPGTLEERMRRSLLEEAIAEAQVIVESKTKANE